MRDCSFRKGLVVGIIILFFGVSIMPSIDGINIEIRDTSNSGNCVSTIHMVKCTSSRVLIPNRAFIGPMDIDLEDAAFHRSRGRYHGEYWYFEGIFDNGYSVVLGVIVVSKGYRGICSFGLKVYNNTEMEVHVGKSVPMKEFEASEDFPFIKVSGKAIIELDWDRYNDTEEWVYNVSLEIDGQEANLQFTGTTEGCKGKIRRAWCSPILPKATVEGTLILNGEKINVSGLGYHEHLWEITFPIWEWGWYWSKIVSNSFSLTVAKVMWTRWREQAQAAILSLDQAGYIFIKPEYIKFKTTDYKLYNRRIIPTKFILKICDPDNSIYINVTMESINIHCSSSGILYRYWRYHVKVNGEITYGSTTETIKDHIQIMELMRFR